MKMFNRQAGHRSVNRSGSILALLLSGVLLIAGCSAEKTGRDGGSTNAEAENGMGRYMETVYDFPEEINRNGGLNILPDGSLSLIDFGTGLWVSADGGQSWEAKDTSWYPMMENVYCLSAAMGPDGSVAITCSGEMPEAAREAYQQPLAEDWEGNYCVFAGPDGDVKVVDFGFSQEDGNCIQCFFYKEDGRLFASDMGGKVCEVDVEKETLKELFSADRSVGSVGFCESILAAVGHDRLYLYDLDQQVLLSQDTVADEFIRQTLPDGKVSYTGGGFPLAVCGGQEENTIYFACEDGLYRHALGGSVMEQVIDGALSTFGDAYATIYRITVLPDREFLAQFDPSAGLIRYTWDANVPSMPDRELRIYSLEECSSIRRAVTAYKKEHTDVYVRYEVGMEAESGITKEDALRKLNTEILSNEGPDVLVLDGLPVTAYKEKEMLQDMKGILDGLTGEDAVFPNLLAAFEEDGKVYGMPVSIRVPLLAGEQEFVAGITDLVSFADGMERLREENPSGGLLGIYDEETLLRLFGMVSSPAWQKEDGSVDEAAVTDFFVQMKRIWEAEQQGAVAEEVEKLEAYDQELLQYGRNPVDDKQEICTNVLNIPTGYAKAAVGYVEDIQLCLDNVTSVIEMEEGLGYTGFPGQSREVFLPQSLVGVSSRASNTDDAMDFVRSIFTKETQTTLYGGFPVNEAAFAERFDWMEDHEENGQMILTLQDGTEKELSLYWPDAEEEQRFTGLVQSLRTPAPTGEYIAELVYKAGIQVLEGKISEKDAGADIVKKAAIYLAE